MASELWVEKYRPKSVNDYVFRDDRLRQQVSNWIKEKSIPHILLSGGAGTGKSSLAGVLLNEIGIDPGDIMYINASDQSGVETVRGQIIGFASTVSMGDFKVVLLEEFDYMSQSGMAILRRVMEDYSEACRFILTCNYIHKVIPAIRSRCQEVAISYLDEESFKMRILEILLNEDIEVDETTIDTVDTYIKATYPDMRKCINTIQLNTQEGKLLPPDANNGSSADWNIQAIELFKKGQIAEARKLIADQLRPEEFEDFYKLCYRNLNWWGKDAESQDEAILIIRDGLVKDSLVADREINLSATLIQLARIAK